MSDRIDDVISRIDRLESKLDMVIRDHENRISKIEAVLQGEQRQKGYSLRIMAIVATLGSSGISSLLTFILLHIIGK